MCSQWQCCFGGMLIVIMYHYVRNLTNTDLPGYGTLELQARVVYGELADVLESDFTSDIAALVKVKTFYESCTNIEAIESSGWTPLRNLYKEIGM